MEFFLFCKKFATKKYFFYTVYMKRFKRTEDGVTMEEKMLIKRAVHGDTEAFAALYEKFYKDMYRFALYSLRNAQDAEDMVSETVTEAFSSIRRLRREEAFSSWIFRILANKCKHKLKEYYNTTVELTEDFPLAENVYLDEQIMVRKCFFDLAEEERLILGMHIFCGYKSREIAGILGLNENTVRSKENRALKKLGKELKDMR